MAKKKNYETPKVLHDTPVGDGRADFHFDDYAATLARLIADKKTETPLAIGVSGSWGAGKTTLLKRVQSMLKPLKDLHSDKYSGAEFINAAENPQRDYRACRTVWFNAWKYAEEDELLVALVRVIVQAMYADDFISKGAAAILDPLKDRRDVIDTVLRWFSIDTPFGSINPNTGEAKTPPLAEKTAVLDLFDEAFDRLMAAWVHRKTDVKKIDETKGVLVVFIDDLDRCLPEKTVQVLEAVKLFLDKKGCIFVLGADTEVVRAAVQRHYENAKVEGENADKYLEKVIQLKFELPPIVPDKMQAFLQKQENMDAVMQELWQTLVESAEINPRRVKSVINDVNLLWTMFKNSDPRAASVDRADFIRWQAVNHAAPDDFKKRVQEMDKELRYSFAQDAVRWGKGEGDETVNAYFEPYENYSRLKRALRNVTFSAGFNADALDAFIFLTAPAEKPRPEKAPAEMKEKAPEMPEEALEAPFEGEADPGAAEKRMREMAEQAARPAREGARTFAGLEFMPIPAGKFIMGSKEDDPDAYDDESPQHTLELPAFFMARFPVTNADYRRFAGSNFKIKTGKENHPVVRVSWEEAQKYVAWLNENHRADLPDDYRYCLPSEAEWEKAARGAYGNIYPWGNEFDKNRCNSSEAGKGGTTPVDAYPNGASPYGVLDMSGNVWEWTRSLYKPYRYNPTDGREDEQAQGARVLRGGSFDDDRRYVRCAVRYDFPVGYLINLIGFRVAASLAKRPQEA
ncbi:MAG: hypothetical protein Kow002_11910 [Anaerolineales bacterium]